MKNIILKSIKVENFRGMKQFRTEFGKRQTVICGDNATGKSTVFAAFTWCLFGKDERDRKDFEIKPCVDGKPVRTTTAVEVALEVEGTETVLRREYAENWVKHKGEAQETFEGNVTTCFQDGAPITVTEYAKRVEAIVDVQTFKIMSNPAYFPNMKWQDQRELLFKVADVPEDSQIAKDDPELAALLDSLQGKSLKDFKAERNRSLKTLKKEAAEIQPRIDEVRRGMYETTMTEEDAQRFLKECDESIKQADAQLASVAAAETALSERIAAKRKEMDALRAQAMKLVDDAKAAEADRVAKANVEVATASADFDRLKRKTEGDSNYIESFKRQDAILNSEMESDLAKHKELCTEYTAESGKTFTPDGMNCPACGRPMTQQQIYTAELEFNERKAKALEDITVRGTAIKKRIEQRKSEMEVRAQKLASMQATLEEDRAKLAQLDSRLKTMTEEAPAVIVPEDVPGYMEKMAKIEETRLQMEAIEKEGANQDDKQAVLAAKQQATGQRDMLMKTLEAHNANTASEVRIKELEARGRELGQQIADIEKDVFTAERLEAARTDALEESVNTMFDTVKFRLFDTTLEGNRVETCVAVVGDALYPVANSAAKLNAGIDIIATLSTKLGCRCPIFIDNAEGVTSIEGRGLQIIELRVERGSQLEVTTIEY